MAQAHLAREVTFLIKVHKLVFLAVHPQAKLEWFSISVKTKFELTQTVEELGQVTADLGKGPRVAAVSKLPQRF